MQAQVCLIRWSASFASAAAPVVHDAAATVEGARHACMSMTTGRTGKHSSTSHSGGLRWQRAAARAAARAALATRVSGGGCSGSCEIGCCAGGRCCCCGNVGAGCEGSCICCCWRCGRCGCDEACDGWCCCSGGGCSCCYCCCIGCTCDAVWGARCRVAAWGTRSGWDWVG